MAILPRIIRIQKGDIKEKEQLIEEYYPFIIKTISETTNQYVEIENSEELSIGLEAFNDAIDKYNTQRGSFISFAQVVIKNRIIDYMRKIMMQPAVCLIDQCELISGEGFTEKIFLQEEIKQFQSELLEYGIQMEDLVNEAPKHIDTRRRAIMIAKYIASDNEIAQELQNKKTLPISKIVSRYKVTLKILKRSRKFIIAVFVILKSEMDCLQQYIKESEGGERSDV